MKIAFLMYSFIPKMGGAQIFAYNLINQLSANNHEIHIYLPYKSYLQFKKIQNVNNYKVIPILRYENFTAKYWPGLIRYRLMLAQKIKQYDIWQVIGSYPAGWVAKDLAKIVPVVLRSHGDDIQKDAEIQYGVGLNPDIDKKIDVTLSKMTHLVALTETVNKCYRDYGISKKKITEIPNGVNLNCFNIIVDPSSLRKKYGLKNNQILILSVGRYHIKKGYEYIPEAANILKEKGYNFKWIIVGKGISVLQTIIDKEYLNDNIVLIEEIGIDDFFQSDPDVPSTSLVKLYKSANLFVMPSLLETFGMVLIEAMAAGLPIVSTNAPGCRDVIQHEDNGLLVDPKDPISLSESIIKIINDENLKNGLIDSALKSVKKYDWQFVSKKYESLYKRLLYD